MKLSVSQHRCFANCIHPDCFLMASRPPPPDCSVVSNTYIQKATTEDPLLSSHSLPDNLLLFCLAPALRHETFLDFPKEKQLFPSPKQFSSYLLSITLHSNIYLGKKFCHFNFVSKAVCSWNTLAFRRVC